MDKVELKKLLKVIRRFTEMDPQMSVMAVNAFLSVVADEDVSTISDVRDVLLRYGGTRSNVSRNVSIWAEEGWKRPDGTRPDGYGYLRTIPDPDDYRRKLVRVTPKGAAFCAELDALMED